MNLLQIAAQLGDADLVRQLQQQLSVMDAEITKALGAADIQTRTLLGLGQLDTQRALGLGNLSFLNSQLATSAGQNQSGFLNDILFGGG